VAIARAEWLTITTTARELQHERRLVIWEGLRDDTKRSTNRSTRDAGSS
jgi:hypothetical protein